MSKCEIIDFPASRVQRLVILERRMLLPSERLTVVEYFRDLTRQYGFSSREAATEALEAAR